MSCWKLELILASRLVFSFREYLTFMAPGFENKSDSYNFSNGCRCIAVPHFQCLRAAVTMRLWCVEFVGTGNTVHIPGESVGKGAAVDVSCPMQLGLSPVHKHWKSYETVEGVSKQDHSAACDKPSGVFVGYGLLIQKNFWGNCLDLFGQGLCWADPLSALSTTFLRGCLSCIHFNSCAFFFNYCVCGASC